MPWVNLTNFILRFCVKIRCIVTFAQLFMRFTRCSIDHPTPFYGGTRIQFFGPCNDVFIGCNIQKFACIILTPQCQITVPRENRHIRDGVFIPRDKGIFGQLSVQNIQLTFDLHGKTINRIFHFIRGIGIEMTKPTAQIRRAAHLPEQPIHAFSTCGQIGWQKCSEFFRQMDQD